MLAVRLGAGPTIPHAESTIGGRTQEQYEWGRVAGQVAAGLEYRVAAMWRRSPIQGDRHQPARSGAGRLGVGEVHDPARGCRDCVAILTRRQRAHSGACALTQSGPRRRDGTCRTDGPGWTRREWLQPTAAGTLQAAALAGTRAHAAAPPRLGVQLYTVREQLKTRAQATLQAIAAIGYKELEVGRADLASLVPVAKSLGLTAVSTHIEAPLVTGNWEAWADAARATPAADRSLAKALDTRPRPRRQVRGRQLPAAGGARDHRRRVREVRRPVEPRGRDGARGRRHARVSQPRLRVRPARRRPPAARRARRRGSIRRWRSWSWTCSGCPSRAQIPRSCWRSTRTTLRCCT